MLQNVDRERLIAQYLLQINAVVLKPSDPFVWASGWKSPIYCDNRLILSHPAIRAEVAKAFREAISTHYPQAKSLSGVATGGIALAAIAAHTMELPMTYVRGEKKGHGRQNQVEGVVRPNEPIVVIEDLVSTGGSSIKAVEALRDKGAKVLGLIAVFDYGFQAAREAFAQAGVKASSLTGYETLLMEAIALGYIDSMYAETLGKWRRDPANWPA
ncbi:MAG: orotate phosphoribosyltransferase [Bacteroidetes bacterium]|jgi:orotate phosphoribosyltransferase|nr:orotate phosphoribosyltransferase [Bacteroidota bacterium]